MTKSITKQEILSFLKNQKPLLQEKFHITKIGLFGSFSKDGASNTSDIDLLVEFEPGELDVFRIKSQLRNFLEQHLGREVDLANPKYLKPFFKDKILSNAVYA